MTICVPESVVSLGTQSWCSSVEQIVGKRREGKVSQTKGGEASVSAVWSSDPGSVTVIKEDRLHIGHTEVT
ncbi:hypothetical protein AOLI_G00260210 [Acnodon oligacanthus]